VNAIKKNIPNAITSLNLLFGCIALIFIFGNRLVEASWMIVFAGVADFFDGMTARLLKVHSDIGKQLDSLADMVSFGVVPGMMVFKLINNVSYELLDTNTFLRWASLCIPIFAALRLAKFNIDEHQATYFIGVPTPAISLLIVSFPLILNHSPYWQGIYSSNISFVCWFFSILSLVCAALMVLPFPLISLKFKNLSWGSNKGRYILLILSLASIIIFQFAAVPIIMVLYIVLSLFANPAKEVHE
jgi:CDP-diacylglycerol--serine O-phosphatidyltransferase